MIGVANLPQEDCMSTSGPTLDQIKQGMRAGWMAGDFGVVAKTIAGDGEAFVQRLGVEPGTRALDVACGTGNLTLPLARAGASVRGVDIAPNLLEQARERAMAAGLAIEFDEGDAEQLPYPDGSFDLVVSMFGAMFAPRPEVVAAELARVLKPGGRLAMANWTPAGFSGRMFALGARHVAPPPGVAPPVWWGDPAKVRERLGADFEDIVTEPVEITFDLPTGSAGAVSFFRTYFGPTKLAFARLDERGQDAFAADLEALWAGANTASDPEAHTAVPNEYLRVTATRR